MAVLIAVMQALSHGTVTGLAVQYVFTAVVPAAATASLQV